MESSEGKGLTFTIRLPLKEQRVRMLEAGGPESVIAWNPRANSRDRGIESELST